MTKPTAEQLELALKPCPFCGGEAEMFERWSRLWMVKCGACGVLLDPDERSQEACIKEWNRRHTTPEIAAMMSKHVENWPEHKKLSTSIALIDKTIAAALEVHQLAEDQDVAIVLLEALADAIEAGSDAIFLPREKAVQLTVEAFARHRLATEARMAAAVEAERERCARIVERRVEARFNEHGTREWDTNATYYQGDMAEIYEALDEEADEIAAALRALAKEDS